MEEIQPILGGMGPDLWLPVASVSSVPESREASNPWAWARPSDRLGPENRSRHKSNCAAFSAVLAPVAFSIHRWHTSRSHFTFSILEGSTDLVTSLTLNMASYTLTRATATSCKANGYPTRLASTVAPLP